MDETLDSQATPARADALIALDNVLASKTFAKSARLSCFVRYVCEAALARRSAQLTEQHIGVAVFDRPAHYNPADDNIVRASARLLRQRLDQYYQSEGSGDPLRITIPRGGYVPVFTAAHPATPAPAPRDAGQEPAWATTAPASPDPAPRPAPGCDASLLQAAPPRWRRWWPRISAAAVMAVALAVAGLSLLQPGSTVAPQPSALWSILMPKDRDVIFVVPDTGLVLLQLETRRAVPKDDYFSRRVAAPAEGGGDATTRYHARRYTGISSVQLAAELGKRASAAPDRFHVRYARDLVLDDLKHANVIIAGVAQSNPWHELFRHQLNFHIDWDPHDTGKFLIRNDHPLAGERASYEFQIDDPDKRGFATIAFTRGLNGEGHALLLGGTTSAGTQAAIEFLTSAGYIEPLLRRVRRSDGSIGEFELLLECVLQANGSTAIRVLGSRGARN